MAVRSEHKNLVQTEHIRLVPFSQSSGHSTRPQQRYSSFIRRLLASLLLPVQSAGKLLRRASSILDRKVHMDADRVLSRSAQASRPHRLDHKQKSNDPTRRMQWNAGEQN